MPPTEQIRQQMEALVRESGYHVCMLQSESDVRDYAYSRSRNLYDIACSLLREYVGMTEAEMFINATWKPL